MANSKKTAQKSKLKRSVLPKSYLKWLDSDDKGEVCFEGKVWELEKEDGLLKQLSIDGVKTPFYKRLEPLADSLTTYMDDPEIEGGGVFELSRLKEGIAIADDNSDILFLEPDGSVWGFWHSAHCVIPIADSFSDALIEVSDADEMATDLATSIIGTWKAVSSATHDLDTVLEFIPLYSKYEPDGSCTWGYLDDDEEDETVLWKVVENKKDDRLCLVHDDEGPIYIEIINPTSFSYTNADGDFEMTYEKV